MKIIGIFTNTKRDPDLAKTNNLMNFIKALGCHVAMYDEIYTNPDLLIVLGGDGAVLKASRHAALNGIPLLGINLGNVGYLTDVDLKHAKPAIAKVLEGNYKIEHRMMLEGRFPGSAPRLALNDITIYRGQGAKLIEIEVAINGEFMDNYRGDGIVISSPTGSTAYNLSAGGPILKPDAQMIAITPISPHSLHARPTVVSHTDIITVRFSDNPGISVAFDGEDVKPSKEVLTIHQSQYTTGIIRTTNLGFYDTLRLKMHNQVMR